MTAEWSCPACGKPKHRPENDYEYLGLPQHLREGFRGYIEEHRAMGHFGMAVLKNDLCDAVGRASPEQAIFDVVRWVYNEAPGTCWGSPEKVEAWIEMGKKEDGDA